MSTARCSPTSRCGSRRPLPRSLQQRGERSTPPNLTKAEHRRLRELFRDRKARDREGVFVCEGPRVITAALDAHVPLLECFVGPGASPAARVVAERAATVGTAVRTFEGQLADTIAPQEIFATVPMQRLGLEALDA